MQRYRLTIDFHGWMTLDNRIGAAVTIFRAGDLIADAGNRLAVDQVIGLRGNDFAAVAGGVTEYNDPFHRFGLPGECERWSPAGELINKR